MRNWHLIEKQPLLSEIYKKPPLVSYKRGCSVKDILVRAKLWKGSLRASSLRRSLACSRETRFVRPNRRACSQAMKRLFYALGSRVGLSTPLYTKSVLKCNWHAFLMFSSDGSWSRGTRVNGPILDHFWHLPCTWLDNLCTVIPWLPPAAAAAAPLSFRFFWLPSPCNCPSFVSFSTCCTQKCGTGDSTSSPGLFL